MTVNVMHSKCLIGNTGFVGGNLLAQQGFDAVYNSSNIAEIAGSHFDLAICAGVPATMWKANNDPVADWDAIEGLLKSLRKASFTKMVLVSTISVFDNTSVGCNEETVVYETTLPYGRHRRRLEEIVLNEFRESYVVRLPALFGRFLKKNFIFDLLNPVPTYLKEVDFEEILGVTSGSMLDFVNKAYQFNETLDMYEYSRAAASTDPRAVEFERVLKERNLDSRRFTNDSSTFQLCDLSGLWNDIGCCIENELQEVNLVSEPVAASEISLCVAGEAFLNPSPRIITQDFRSLFVEYWGGRNGYQWSKKEILKRLKKFAHGRDLSC